MKPHASINALNNSIKSHVIYFINRFYDLIVKMQMLIVFHNQGGTFAANLAHSPEKAMTARRLQRRKRQPQCSDRKSTRLNSSHQIISYAVFCLKKKKQVTLYLNLCHKG